MNKNKTGSI